MAQHSFTCQVCGDDFEASRADAVQCSKACSQAAYRARQGIIHTRNSKAAELLRRQTLGGADPVVMAAIAREAEKLFADDV
jgi:hypothetical protein